MQQGMLLSSIDGTARHMYIIQTVFDWAEKISPQNFEAAWRAVAAHHENLRTTFHWRGASSPFQQIVEKAPVTLHCIDAPAQEYSESLMETFLHEDLEQGFLLSDAPPWRITLLRFKDDRNFAVWTFHHLLFDGRSHVQVLREVLAVYDALIAGEPPASLQPEMPHRLYVEWLEQQDFSADKEFWIDYLSADKLPSAFPQPHTLSSPFNQHTTYRATIDSELTGQIQVAAKSIGVSAGNLVQGAWGLLLGWLSNETDVTFGAVRACRKSGPPDGDSICGMVINTLPLRVQWDSRSSIADVLRKVAVDWQSFRDREHTPLQQIGRWIGLPSSRELFTSAVSFSNQYFDYAVQSDSSRRAERHLWLRQTTPYIALDASFDGASMTLSVDLPPRILDAAIGSQLATWLRNVIQGIVADPQAEVRSLSPLGDKERQQIIFGMNPHWEQPPETIHWLSAITNHAQEKGDAPALSSDGEQVGWKQMEQRSNQMARLLRERGIGREDVVAIFLPRSPEYIWTCLGVLKAGAAYLPIDAHWPSERIAMVLQDALPKAVLSSSTLDGHIPAHLADCWQGAEEIKGYSDDPLTDIALLPDQLAYIIYTSGSTGKPKGVEVLHGGLENLIRACHEIFEFTPQDRCSFLSNTAFDASILETWTVLTAGASIYIPRQELLSDPNALAQKLSQERISYAFLPTTLAEAVLQLTTKVAHPPSRILCGGDQLRMVPAAGQSIRLFNGYGPTETTCMTTCYLVDASMDADRNIPIGKPLRGVRAYVLNESQQILPLGVPGELILAGAQLGRGYRNSPDLTAGKFIANHIPEEPGSRLYRTGDLVRWLPDGNLQFLGRIDGQVKVRGFRIELGEIESHLLRHPAVAEAVVLVDRRTPQVRLVAFIVPSGEHDATTLPEELTAYLHTLLPKYMVPGFFAFRDSLPVNTSGKYDRKAILAGWHPDETCEASEDSQPRTETERRIIEIWQKTLGLAGIGRTDHFFSLGADSLSIINVLCAVELELGQTLSVADITNDPTPADLAQILENGSSGSTSMVQPLKTSGDKLPFYCIPGAGGGIHWFRPLADAFDQDRPVFGLEILALSQQTQAHFSVQKAAEEIIDVLLQSGTPSPLLLGGYSGGGLIALEVAQRLRAAGAETPFVLLIETHVPEKYNHFAARLYRWFRGLMEQPGRSRWKLLIERIGWYARFKLNRSQSAPALPAELKGVKERHMDGFFQYQPAPYDGPVVLVAASERPLSSNRDPRSEWKHLLRGHVEVIKAPGDHYMLMAEPGVSHIASAVKDLLDAYDQPHAAVVLATQRAPA
jgi:amino acid adenylation domain-containing protein